VGLTSADCQLPIVKLAAPGLKQSAIGNRQLAVTGPTRYRVVVLTSWDRNRNYRKLMVGLKLDQLPSELGMTKKHRLFYLEVRIHEEV